VISLVSRELNSLEWDFVHLEFIPPGVILSIMKENSLGKSWYFVIIQEEIWHFLVMNQFHSSFSWSFHQLTLFDRIVSGLTFKSNDFSLRMIISRPNSAMRRNLTQSERSQMSDDLDSFSPELVVDENRKVTIKIKKWHELTKVIVIDEK
jgi:hypothetical protein